MANVLIRHTVRDFDEWKTHFDARADVREEHGAHGYQLFRDAEDGDEVTILFEWDSTENARRFFEESDVRDVMADAGVVGDPDVWFLDEVEASIPRMAG
ncbi:MAG: antibiotic biosynthesis monooxygenase [Halobacteriaceae archaeon]